MGQGEVDAGELHVELSNLARSSSSSSSSSSAHHVQVHPPLPPPDFNPLPDFTTEAPLHGISPPGSIPSDSASTIGSGSSSTTLSASTSHTALQEAVNRVMGNTSTDPSSVGSVVESGGDHRSYSENHMNSDLQSLHHLNFDSPLDHAASIPPLPLPPSGGIRPQPLAIQRLSSESVPLSGQSSRSSLSTMSTGSEGGGHLIEMRERLLSEVSASVSPGSGSSSRRDSNGSGSAASFAMMKSPSGGGGGKAIDEGLESHLTNAIPPLTEDALSRVDGTFRPRPDSMESVEDAAVHAWDSVWPQPNAAHRVNLPPEVSSAKFPLAPMSPYQTPAFSPALIPIRTGPQSSTSPDRERERDREQYISSIVQHSSQSQSQSPPPTNSPHNQSQSQVQHSSSVQQIQHAQQPTRRKGSINESSSSGSRAFGHQRSRSGASPTRGGASSSSAHGSSRLSESYSHSKSPSSPGIIPPSSPAPILAPISSYTAIPESSSSASPLASTSASTSESSSVSSRWESGSTLESGSGSSSSAVTTTSSASASAPTSTPVSVSSSSTTPIPNPSTTPSSLSLSTSTHGPIIPALSPSPISVPLAPTTSSIPGGSSIVSSQSLRVHRQSPESGERRLNSNATAFPIRAGTEEKAGSPVSRASAGASALGTSPPQQIDSQTIQPFTSSSTVSSSPFGFSLSSGPSAAAMSTRSRKESISTILSPASALSQPTIDRADSPRPDSSMLARRNSAASIVTPTLSSLSSLQKRTASEEVGGHIDDYQRSNSNQGPSLTPMSLPPAIVSAPIPSNDGSIIKVGDDGMFNEALKVLSPPSPPMSGAELSLTQGFVSQATPLFAPVARPAILRRAMSEQDARARKKNEIHPPSNPRTLCDSGPSSEDGERSGKRQQGSTDLRPLHDSTFGDDPDTVRNSKSPRRSPFPLPTMSSSISNEENIKFGMDAEDIDEIMPHTVEYTSDGPKPDYAFPATTVEGMSMSQQAYSGQISNEPGYDNKERDGGSTNSAEREGEWATTSQPKGGRIAPDETGDIFPEAGVSTATYGMDVTFDDEGLNTLERIFLLSRSEYPFHRAYVARVLGDLLVDVDPCESVEYVLPLVSGFSMDEDETVKEAFATELHRILWYFYSTCQLLVNDVPAEELYDPSPGEVTTVTSEGVQVVPRPTPAEAAGEIIPVSVLADRRASIVSLGPSSGGFTLVVSASSPHGVADTSDGETTAASSSSSAAQSSVTLVNPFDMDGDEEKGWAKDQGPTMEPPAIAVDFFRPLLGTLLLSDNPAIADPVRTGIIAIIGRLKNKTPLTVDTWGVNVNNKDYDSSTTSSSTEGRVAHEKRTYVSQTGPHSHEIRPFSAAARAIVENELLQGIVIGMGRLNTNIPETLLAETLEGAQRALEIYAEHHDHGQAQAQGEQRANSQVYEFQRGESDENHEDEECRRSGAPFRRPSSDDGDIHIDQAHRRSFDQSQLSSIGLTSSTPDTTTATDDNNDSVTDLTSTSSIQPNGFGNDNEVELFREQIIHEARVGRALSLSFIGSISEFYSAEEIVEYGFVDEVLRGSDGDDTTRAEAALAMSLLAKVVPVEHVYRMIPIFQLFATDEVDHVRQSSCLCLPALCRRIESHEYRRTFAINAINSFISPTSVDPNHIAGGSVANMDPFDPSHVQGGSEIDNGSNLSPFGGTSKGFGMVSQVNEDVRYAALEMLGEVIHAFVEDPHGPPEELLSVYLDDSFAGQPDNDWDIIASYNFPGVCLTLGPERWHELRDLFQRLQSRAGDRVLSTIAAFLHELARILSPDQVATDIVPAYQKCLSNTESIRERVLENVDVLISRVPRNVGWKLFVDLSESWQNGTLGGWRVRERLALHIPAFLKAFSNKEIITDEGTDEVEIEEEMDQVQQDQGEENEEDGRLDDEKLEKVLDMMRAALLDPFAAVRDAATLAVPTSYEILMDGTKSAEKFRNILLDLALSDKYRQRLTFVRCLREFVKPPPNRSAFEEFFAPCLIRLSRDVVDVRLGLAQAIANLFVIGAFYGEDDVPIPSQVRHVASELANDDSIDVRNTVKEISPNRLVTGDSTDYASPKGEIVPPYHASPSSTVDRSAEPGESHQPKSNLAEGESAAGESSSTSLSAPVSGSTSISTCEGTESIRTPTSTNEGLIESAQVENTSTSSPSAAELDNSLSSKTTVQSNSKMMKMGFERKDSLGIRSAMGEMNLGNEGDETEKEKEKEEDVYLKSFQQRNLEMDPQLSIIHEGSSQLKVIAVPEVADPFEVSFSRATSLSND